ncbi:MAG: DUF3953 domain-containing protein [Methanomassiliicoccaceae archaeon]|jgi:hypothetical protein|nr:DUF3953 domain-containing protein [Methanomassiliicoccaceae archaeon]
MSGIEDILKDSSLVAIIAGVIGLFIVLGDDLGWIGLVLLGLIAFVIGLVNYMKNNKDIIALIAAILGVIVIVVAIWEGVIR